MADHESFDVNSLFKMIDDATKTVTEKINKLQSQGSNVNIGDMFEMQMLMNRLSQLSEMGSSVISASNSAIASMARNVKS